MFDWYSRRIYELTGAFLNASTPAAAPANLDGLLTVESWAMLAGLAEAPANIRRRLRFEDLTGDSVPLEIEDGYTPWLPPTNPPGPTPPTGSGGTPGGGGGPGGTIGPGGGGPFTIGPSTRLEMAPPLPGLTLPTLMALSYALQGEREEDTFTVPDTQFPILDRFANGTTESFWSIPAGSTFTEPSGTAQATMNVGGRAMIGSRTFTNCTAFIQLSSLVAEAVDGVLARANLSGPISGYCARYVEASDTLALYRIDAGSETLLASTAAVGVTAGDRIGIAVIGDSIESTINGSPIDSATDATYASGYVGTASFGLSTAPLSEFSVIAL